MPPQLRSTCAYFLHEINATISYHVSTEIEPEWIHTAWLLVTHSWVFNQLKSSLRGIYPRWALTDARYGSFDCYKWLYNARRFIGVRARNQHALLTWFQWGCSPHRQKGRKSHCKFSPTELSLIDRASRSRHALESVPIFIFSYRA